MEDRTISLNAAIKTINDYWGETYQPNIDGYIECLKQLPSVTPKTGQWIKKKGSSDNYYYYECSRCGCLSPHIEYADSIIWKLNNYCPDCGALMEGTIDE